MLTSDKNLEDDQKTLSIIYLKKKTFLHVLLNIRKIFFDWVIKKEKIILIKRNLENITSYEEFKKYSLELDKLEGKEQWKKKKESKLYDFKEVEKLIKILQAKKEANDINGIVHYLRSNLLKNLYSTNNPELYHNSNYGTKYLIEDFESEIVNSLKYVYEFDDSIFPLSKKLEFFSESRHAYGRTALLLSGGASFGMYHMGVIKALYEQKLLPRIICGSSAGSIVASLICTSKYEDVLKRFDKEIKEGPFALKEFKLSFLQRILRYVTTDSLFNVDILKEFLRDNIGDLTFQEAFDMTGWILNITVTGFKEHDNHRLMNYLTAPNVLIWSAACASSALPGIFDPVELHCKNEYGQIVPYSKNRTKFIDGSISNDLPMQRVSELFNVNSFIVSQTNPFAIPFMDTEDGRSMIGNKNISFWALVKNLIGSEIRMRISQLNSLNIIPNSLQRWLKLFTQEYRGDITIFPVPINIRQFSRLLSNPTKESIENYKICGKKKTFPKICKIKHLLKIEMAIDKYYRKVKYTMKNNNKELIKQNFEKDVIIEDFETDSISENDDLNQISERHNSFIIYSKNIKKPRSQISLKELNRNGKLILTRNDSFNIPRNVSSFNIYK